jgi:hypothetical protein
MNVFGISITRRTAEQLPAVQPAVDADGRPISQARLFATEYAAHAAREQLDTIDRNARNAETVTKLALGVSMPHQVGYLLSLAPLTFGGGLANYHEWLASATLLGLAFLAPVVMDYLILICVRTIAARASATISKVVAGVAMLFPVGFSGTVNFIAPAPLVIRIAAAAIVVVIPISQAVRAFNRPDFAKVESMENALTAQLAPVAVAAPVVTGPAAKPTYRNPSAAELAARKRSRPRYEDMTADEKRRWTKQYRIEEDARTARTAPTSPGQPPVATATIDQLEDLLR